MGFFNFFSKSKKSLLIFSGFFFFISSTCGNVEEENKIQHFCDLLHEARLFEAFDYYESNQLDTAGFEVIDWTYKAYKFNCFNQPDSAITYLNSLLTKYKEFSWEFFNQKIPHMLMLNYKAKQEYGEAVRICDDIMSWYRQYPDSINLINDTIVLKEIKNVWVQLMDEKKMEIHFHFSKTEVPMDTTFLTFKGIYNGIELNTLFDTGASCHLLMDRRTADKVKVNILSTDTLHHINDTILNSSYGILDSFWIGNLEINNIPVFIFNDGFFGIHNDSIKNANKELFESFDVVLGWDLMRMFGAVSLDFEIQCLVIEKPNVSSQKKNNLLICDKGVFLRSHINDIDFTGYFDTGSTINGLLLKKDFYLKFTDAFEVDSLDSNLALDVGYLTSYYTDLQYKNIKKVDWKIHEEQCVIENDLIVLLSDDPLIPGMADGVYGELFIKEFKKVYFDFANMNFYIGK